MNQPEFQYLGPYRVERVLGRGGMGTVYKGVHARSGEAAAIKVIARGVANQQRFIRRFTDEMQTLQRLRHPNIVSLKGTGEEHGYLFYTMEFVDGHSLHQHLRMRSKLPWQDVIEIGIQTASALKHAHDLGIIHRDLKPANLMLNTNGNVKLTDFGIAKLFGSQDQTAAGTVLGTADFMPPEQAEGKSVTAQSDLYSLGAVMYALLSGQAPFSGKSIPEVLYAVRYAPLERLEDLVADAPTELCELVHELLDKDPQKRPRTGLVVSNRLRSLKRGLTNQKDQDDAGGTTGTGTADSEIGKELTSLDLSDVNDNELRLTGEDRRTAPTDAEHQAFEPADPSYETDENDSGVGTHEQATLLAPDQADPDSQAKRSKSEPDFAVSPDSIASGQVSVVPPEKDSQLEEGSRQAAGRRASSHYTPINGTTTDIDQEVDSDDTNRSDLDWVHYTSVALMGVLLIGTIGFGWYLVQPRDADAIYRGLELAVESDDEEQLNSSKDDIEEFLDRFPEDVRSQDLRLLVKEIELARWTRILKRRASRSSGRHELSAIERGFVDCMTAREQNASVAEKKIEALLTIGSNSENLSKDEKTLLELASFAKTSESNTSPETSEAAEQLGRLIEQAKLKLADDPESLEEYYQAVIELYGDKSWARGQLEQISEELNSKS